MDQQVLKDLVATTQGANYQWETVLPLFPELSGIDPQVLKDYVETAESNNYDYDKIRKYFPEFETTGEFQTLVEETEDTSTESDIPTEEEIEKKKAEEDAIIAERKANVARFNALSEEEQRQEAIDAGYKQVTQNIIEEYRQSLMGAEVTEDIDEEDGEVRRSVDDDNKLDPSKTDKLMTQNNGVVEVDLLTDEERAAENEARQQVDFETWLKDRNDGDYMGFWQGLEGGWESFIDEIGEFVTAPFTKDGIKNYSLGDATQRNQLKYIKEQQAIYDAWKKQYSPEGEEKNSTTFDNYFKKKILNKELYDSDTGALLEGDPEGITNDEYTYGIHNVYKQQALEEYNGLRQDAINNKDQRAIKKYFGVDISKEKLKSMSTKDLSVFLGMSDPETKEATRDRTVKEKDFLALDGVEKKAKEIADKHGFTIDELLNVIQKESDFNTSAENPTSKATGLIQFMPKTAKGLGTSIEEISKMTASEQLDLIDKYFTQNHKKGEHPYITIAYPAAKNMGMDDIIAGPNDSIAIQNPVWQNKDGNVTKRSILEYAGYASESQEIPTEEPVEEYTVEGETEEDDGRIREAGLTQDDFSTIFGDNTTAKLYKSDFQNWFKNNSRLQGQMKLLYNEEVLEDGSKIYTPKRGEDARRQQQELDIFRAEVMEEYFLHKSNILGEDFRRFENKGIKGIISRITAINEKADRITGRYNEALEKLNEYKSGFEDGTIKKTKENVAKHNKLIEEINGYSADYDKIVEDQEELMTPKNQQLLDSYMDLQDESQELKKMRLSFLENTEYGKLYSQKIDLQEMANKGDRWFQDAAGVGDLVTTVYNWIPRTIGGVSTLTAAGLEKIGVIDEEDLLQYRRRVNLDIEDFSIVNNQTPTVDPVTLEVNYSRLLPNVGSTVLDMGLMIYTGGRSYAVSKAAGRYARKKLKKITPGKTLTTISPYVKKAASGGSTAVGSLPVLYPAKLDEAMSQISEDFTPEDAVKYAGYSAVTEALIEVLNPDWKWTKLNVAKLKKSLKPGESIVDALINARKIAFKQSLKTVPQELLEEFIQNASNGYINKKYNENFNTEFEIPGAASYKETAILTALSVLTMRGLSGNLTNMNQTSIYRAASENYPAFIDALNKNLEEGTITPEQAIKWRQDVEMYTMLKGEIDDLIYDEDGKVIMDPEQQDRLIEKLTHQRALQAKIDEDPNGPLVEDLKKELEAVTESINNERNIIESESSQREIDYNNYLLKDLEEKIKNPKTTKEALKELKKERAKLKKANKKLKAFAPEYSIAGKSYNNKAAFLKAIRSAKYGMRDPNKRKNLRIKVKNDTEAEKEAYKILGKYAPKGIKSRVVMTTKEAADAETFIDKRTEIELREELKKELDKRKSQRNQEKIQQYKDALKYLELKKNNYQFGKKGYLVDPVILSKLDLKDLQLEGNIEAVRRATKQFGGEMEVLTNEEALEKYGQQAWGANGFFAPKRDKDGNVIGFVHVVNKDVARKMKARSVASHELLHNLLYTLINGPARQITDPLNPDGPKMWVTMSEEGKALIKGFINKLSPEQLEVLNKKLDEGGYRFAKYDSNGVGVPGTELAFEEYGEEYLNKFHDVTVSDKHPLFVDAPKSWWKKIIDYFNNLFNRTAPELININIEDSQDLLNFLNSYNKQAVEERFNSQVIEMGKKSLQDRKDILLVNRKNEDYQRAIKNDPDAIVYSRNQKPLNLEAKADLFSKTNEELSMALQAYGLEGEFDPNNEEHLDIWNSISKQEKLFIGYSIGDLWRNHAANKLFIQYGNTANFSDYENDILDVLTKGVEVGQNGLPYIVSTWDPTQRKLTSHIWDLLPTRIPHVTRLPQFAGFGKSLDAQYDDDINQAADDTPSKINILKFERVRNKLEDIRKIVKVKKGDSFAEVSDLKNIEGNTGRVAQVIFGVPAKKILDRNEKGEPISANLTYAKKIVNGIPELSEAGNIQDFYRVGNNAEKLIKILPKESVSSEDADINELGENIDVSRDVLGRAIGLTGRTLNYFYNKTNRRSKGLSSQPFIWELKPEFRNPSKETVDKLKEDLGITPKGELNNYDRTNIGQLLKGIARFQAQQTTLSTAQRILEPTIAEAREDKRREIKQQIANIRAGQSNLAFSRSMRKIDQMIGMQHAFDLEINGIDKLLESLGKKASFNLKTEKGRKDFIEAIKKDLFPMFPKEFFFSFNKKGEVTGSIFTASNANYDLSMSKYTEKDKKEKLIPKGKKVGDFKKPEEAALYEAFRSEIFKLGKLDKTNFGKPIKDANWDLTKGYNTIFGKKDNYLEKMKDKKRIREWNANVALIHKEMWNRFNEALQDDPNSEKAQLIGTYLKLVANDKQAWHRLGAQLEGYSIELTKRKDGSVNIEFEHAMPATAAYLYLLNSAINPDINFDVSYELVIDNYKLIVLDKAMDDKLRTARTKSGYSLQRRMPDNWSVLTNDWWERYFNDIVNGIENGIDPNSIVDLDGVTFAKKYGIKAIPTKKGTKKIGRVKNAIDKSRTVNPNKGITVLDFDDTLATTKSRIRYTKPDGTKGSLNAEEYARDYVELSALGYKWDFSEFNEVVDGKKAPLFEKALKLQGKFGPENMFILTARPPESQKAIFEFLKANGLDIPMENITGLGNSTPEAKALWIADKVAEGYNDFYFADDALQNVQAVDNMLEQFDVKRKVQQAKLKFSKSINTDFNDILEDISGIESEKRFSAIKGRKRGANKGKFRFFIPPSHEDFTGLLYNFIGKGRKGDQHRDFFEEALIRPLNRADRELNAARQAIANDYKQLNKQFPNIRKRLVKKTPDGDFTYQDAIRVYLWNKHGYKIPGLSKTDQQNLSDLVASDAELRNYAEILNTISKQDAYVSPTESWTAGDIRTDLDDATGRIGRAQFFAEFLENAGIIFSEENLNKIEAIYGSEVVSAIKDMLYRIETGRNRPSGQSGLVNRFMNYVNGSVAATMFINMRSVVLQQMSLVNFINYSDNNIVAAAKAFFNQKQYWRDWAYLFNSDFMKQRRGGIQTDVNGAELAAELRNAKNKPRALIAKLLQFGFTPTQIGDNIAIASGGATYYRNRINTYLKQGLSQKEAEAKAFIDFQALAEATQQSAKPWMVSQQQASPLGKIILAFQNVTSQFNRLGKKAFLDLYNRRISPEYRNASNPQLQSDMSNLSRITYYFAIQNMIFYSLQSALFLAMFGSEDEEEDEKFLKKKERMINGTIDSILRGTGVVGSAIATLKNMAIKWHEQRQKGYNKDESAVLMEMLNVSPPVGIKARKIVNAEKTLNYNKDIIKEMDTFDIDNPMWSAVTNYIEATTNIPVNRIYNKTINVRDSLNNRYSALKRVLMFSGWSRWNLMIDDTDKIKEVKETVKEKKKIESKQKAKIKKEQKKKEQEEANKTIIEENKEKSKKDGICAAISKDGVRCKKKAINGGFCTVHEKKEQTIGGKKSQCKRIKSDGTRCKMQTSNKSGYCYYHD